MKNACLLVVAAVLLLSSCARISALQNTQDYEYKYEAAKTLFAEGKHNQASVYFAEVLAVMRGTANAEESLYLAALSTFLNKDYENATSYFRKYLACA